MFFHFVCDVETSKPFLIGVKQLKLDKNYRQTKVKMELECIRVDKIGFSRKNNSRFVYK